MDVITASIVSGAVYDIFKAGVGITASALKERLQKWLIDDLYAEKIAKELNAIQLNDELSEKAIERKIAQSYELLGLIEELKSRASSTQIHQVHSGAGDNIGRDKITY